MAQAPDSPYSSPGTGSSSGIHRSTHSSSQHPSALQPGRPLPPLPVTARPDIRTGGSLAASSSRASVGSKIVFEAPASDIFDQPPPLTYSYGTFMNDLRSMEQSTIDMPDHNEFVPVMDQSNRSEASSLPRLDTRSPPYPIHDEDWSFDSSADAFHSAHSESFRHPTMEDFSRLDHPLPPPPPKAYDSDQDLPIIELDSRLPDGWLEQHGNSADQDHTTQVNSARSQRRSTEPAIKSHSVLGIDSHNGRSQSELIPPSYGASHEPADTDRHDAPVRVQTISSDMYQPTLGGSQRVSAEQRKGSKRDRVKRFLRKLNPFRQRRLFGRAKRR